MLLLILVVPPLLLECCWRRKVWLKTCQNICISSLLLKSLSNSLTHSYSNVMTPFLATAPLNSTISISC